MSDPVYSARSKVPNRFLLCVVAFERSKQLIKGARPRTERRWASVVNTALQEIVEGRLQPSAGNEKHWVLA